ncbi:chloramphenicol acetyltransferase CAT [Nakamurella flava]|uniref:Chloramphenicol acetyltransferase n=1 Tax=Nakamurella flava TaxID=2576308 RepID=A0A4U6QP24_9ACTN|nr:chloramphenicol acetyltransferase CAT [Nakamurella flava]
MGLMPGHRPVVLDTWPRRPHFEHYLRQVPCTFSLTVELDVTDFAAALADSPLKTYPAQIWALATVVNRHEEFRMFVDDDDTPAVWDVVHPSLTVFNPERETFASVWVPYATDLCAFHRAAADLLTTHRSATELFPQGDPPPNTFDVSSLPWTSFTGFTLDIRDGHSHLAPIITLGRYARRDGRTLMPVALQVHHAVADGFHASRLLADFARELADVAAFVRHGG